MYSRQNCELIPEPHDWVEETQDYSDGSIGQGKMKQRRCMKCQAIDYIEFTDKDGKVTTYKTYKLGLKYL